ncbi:MAG: GHKL domain-containing protein, partial [Erysipelotrichaceae bacterium]|nr:GHKL domain-containing protein [Erysipelotrichaceae bacterium]
QHDQPFVRLILASALMIAFLKWLKKVSWLEAIFWHCGYLLMAIACEISAMVITMFLVNFDMAVFFAQINQNFYTFLISDMLSFLAIYFAVYFRNRWRRKYEKLTLLIIFLSYQFMMLYLSSFKMNVGWQASGIVFISFIFLLVIVDSVAFYLIKEIYYHMKDDKYSQMEAMLSQQMQAQFDRLFEKQQVLEEIYDEILGNSTDILKLEAYRNELKEIHNHFYCEHAPVNAMLDYYDALCDEHGIAFEVNFKGALPKAIDVFDLNTLLINCLQNAMDEVVGSDKGWIKLEVACKDMMLFLQCTNSLNHDQKPKKVKKIAGNGKYIVKNIVAKYGGYYAFDILADQAKVTINLTLKGANSQ